MLADQAHGFVEDGASFMIAAIIFPETTSMNLIEEGVPSLIIAVQSGPAFVHASTNRELRADPCVLGTFLRRHSLAGVLANTKGETCENPPKVSSARSRRSRGRRMSLGLACKDIGMQWSRGKWIGQL
jgi:hypothetical protein